MCFTASGRPSFPPVGTAREMLSDGNMPGMLSVGEFFCDMESDAILDRDTQEYRSIEAQRTSKKGSSMLGSKKVPRASKVYL